MVQSLLRSDSFRILFNSPELSEVQRSGFHLFLKKGIAEELSKISCIQIKNVHFLVEIFVDASNFRLVAPENSYRDCILKMKSYTCKLYVQTKILLKDKVSEKLLHQTQPEWVLLADLPMMTRRGHFVINGSPRIIVHQVGRAPGIYFKKVLKVKNDVTNKARFYGDIIPRKGVWVRLQINKKGEIDLKLKKSKKVRAEMVQKCLELLEKEKSFSCFQNFVAGSQTKQDLLFATAKLKGNLNSKQSGAYYKTNPFSSTYKPNFNKATFYSCNRPVNAKALQKRSFCTAYKGVQRLCLCYAFVRTKPCKNAVFASRLHKRSLCTPRFVCATGGVPALFVQSTAKEQALIRNLFYFKSIKIKIVSKARSKSQLPNASKNKNNPGLLNKTKFNTVSFFARKISNTTNHINLHTFSSIHFLDNLDSSKYHERYQLALNKSPVYLPLNTNTCASNKIVRGFVIKYNSSKSFSAFTKTEKEAFANVYTSFYKNEIQDIEKRVSVSKNALLTHTKPSQNLAKPLPLKSNLLRAHELQIKSKNKSIPKTRLVKTKFSSSLSESQTKQSLVTTRASLGYDSKDKIVKKKNLSNNLKKIREYLYQLFKESDLYDLGSVGRDKINSKFGISIKETQLTALDIKKTINWLSRLRAGKEEIDDIDHSQNRRVRTSSELIQAQFEIGITRLKNGVLKRVLSPSGAINVKGEQIKASFDKKIQAKQSKVFLFEKNGYEELVRPRLLFCTNLIKHKTLAQNKVMQKQNKQTGFACKKPDACTNEAVLAKALLRTLDAQNSFVQSKIINNTPSFYSQIFWQSNKQSGANKADVCFANNFNLNSVFHAHSLPSSRVKVINKQTGLFHFVPVITCYLSIVFVESDFGLQIVKPVARAQTNSNKKQLNFEFTRLHFKGGNSCFVKQDVMSVILKPSKTKIQAFFSTGGCQNEVGLLAKICTGKASACTKPCKNAVFASRLQKRGLQRHGPNKGRAFVRKSFALASRLQKRSFLQVPLWHGFLQQKSSTLTQDALYPSNDLVSNLSASEWFSTKPINGALREFFSSSPLSQYMDQTNPLAEITHKRRISSLGAGGVSRESAGMTIRGIHPTHYGRICPIETPEGKNAGLVNSLAFYARINNQGFIETPYYQVIKGQVQHELGFSFYSAGQESRNGLSIAPNDIKQSRSKLLASNISTIESIPVRIADNLLDLFKKKRPSQVNCIGISPVQILSVATSLIPFLEHNDANRALMGSNMQRQAVSLMSSERPLVGTGLEARVLVESGHLVQSKVSGFISNVSAHRVIVERLMFDFNKKDALFSNYFVTKQSINRELHFLDLYKKPASLPQPTATLSQNSVLTKTFDDTVKQKRLLASGLFVRRASLNINWSIKKQNNNQSKYKQKFTKLNSTILDIVVAFTQPLKIQTKQSLLTQKSLGTTKLVQLIDPFTKTKVALLPVIHPITTFSRSNQETCLTQKPLVEEGDWVQKGDILSDCSAGQKGELSVGKNMFIAYIPWQGYNFEDAIVISDRLVKEQLYTSLHIERYTVIVNDFKDKVVDTNEWFTGKLPGVDSKKRAHLQKSGLPRIGATLREGDILVGKIKYSKKKPATPHEKLVCDILGEHNFSVQNTSLYVPKGVHEARVLTYKIKKRFDKALRTGIATGEMKNETELTKAVPLYAKTEALQKQRPNKTGVYKGITKALPLLSLCKQKQIFNKRLTKTEAVQKAGLGQEQQNMSLKARVGKDGAHLRPAGAPKVVHIFLGEKRNIQIGDKMSGRHGNKGIVSTILPKQDMPYLADGSPIDILLNPLGVPSRMNVGQVFECLLGLASTYLHQNFKITAFDELYGVEASQSLVFLKLYQARLQSGQNWLFQINFPGKTRLTDGRSGECLDQWITVGRAYMLKLIHMVNEKIHARAIGPYALVTQQPLKGRAHKGGQRLGEMEVWAIEGFGAAYILQELLTKKSDDSIGRKEVLKAMLPKSASLLDFMDPFGQSINTSTQSKENKTLYNAALVSSNLNSDLVQHQSFTVLGQPDIFKVLICELQALCLDVGVYSIKTESFQRQFVGIFEQSS